MNAKVGKYLAMAGLSVWALWLILDFVVHRGYALDLLNGIPYPLLWSFPLLLLGGGAWWTMKTRFTGTVRWRGWQAFAAVQFFASFIYLSFGARYVPQFSAGIGMLYYLAYSSLHLLGLYFVLLTAYCAGRWALEPLARAGWPDLTLTGIATGFGVLGFVAAILGLLGLINIYVCWGVCLLIVGSNWRRARDFLRSSLWEEREIRLNRWWTGGAVGVLLFITAFNLIGSFKSFPLGFDGSRLYVNLASLVADTGGLPFGGQAFGWSVMMGFTEVLFGSPVFGILAAHGMSVLVSLAMYRLARNYLSNSVALLAALIPLVTPYFGFHALVDEKVDLAFAFLVLVAMNVLAQLSIWPHRPSGENLDGPPITPEAIPKNNIQVAGRSLPANTYFFGLLGWIVGFAFSVKYTALFFVFALIVWFYYRLDGRRGLVGVFLMLCGGLFLTGFHSFGYLDLSTWASQGLGWGLLLAGVGTILFDGRANVQRLAPAAAPLLAFGLAFGLAFAPWAGKHVAEHGSVGVTQLLEGKSLRPSLRLTPGYSLFYLPEPPETLGARRSRGLRPGTLRDPLPGSYPLATSNSPQPAPATNATLGGAREEIQRYLGYETPFWRYWSLPQDLLVGANLPNTRFIDLGFLLFLFLPVLLFAGSAPRRAVWKPVLAGVAIFVYLALVHRGYATAGADVAGPTAPLAAETPAWLGGLHGGFSGVLAGTGNLLSGLYDSLAALPLWLTVLSMVAVTAAIFGFARRSWSISAGLKSFFVLLGVYGFFWWLLGNGVVWYALPLFVAAPVGVLYFLDHPEQLLGPGLTRFSTYFTGISVGATIVLGTLLYGTSQYPGETDRAAILRWPFVRMISDADYSAADAAAEFNPTLGEIDRIVNADPTAKIYRVNTQTNHVVRYNDLRVYDDPTLERFAFVADQIKDDEYFFNVLRDQDYRYVLLDLNTGRIDQTPEKTLRKKFSRLGLALVTSPQTELLATDNYVADPAAPEVRLPDGTRVNARPGLRGDIVRRGRVALFAIKP